MNFPGTRMKNISGEKFAHFLLMKMQMNYLHVNNGQFLSHSRKALYIVSRMWIEIKLSSAVAQI
jgi:hypothetical protein